MRLETFREEDITPVFYLAKSLISAQNFQNIFSDSIFKAFSFIYIQNILKNSKERQRKKIKKKYIEIKGNYICGQRKLKGDNCVLGPNRTLLVIQMQ